MPLIDPALLPPESPVDLKGIAERRRWLLSYAKRGGIGAEFGVFRGHLAAVIADELKPRKLYLVDPWRLEGERFGWGPDPYTNYDQLTTEQAMLDTKHRLAPFEGQTDIRYVEGYDTDFCAALAPSGEKLDFVYIDTAHTYEQTLQELAAISPLIADDGVILGDDWILDVTHRHHGVMRAVNEFLKDQSGWQLLVAGQDAQWAIRRTPAYDK